jgi:proton glutamate symport protein
VLQIVIFSVLFAIALSLIKNVKHKETMLHWTESLSEVMFKFTDLVMYIAPLAVFGAIASTISKSGIDVLTNLLKLVGTLYVGLIIFVLTVLLPIALMAKIPIKRFLGAITEPLSIAFATASSEAALLWKTWRNLVFLKRLLVLSSQLVIVSTWMEQHFTFQWLRFL